MAVNVPNPGSYMGLLGGHCTAFRDALNNLINDAAYLQSMGGATFLEAAPFNLSPTDAAVVMSTIGVVTPTNTTVVTLQAFIASTEPLWGGN
jgi:hypothetical protein